MPLFSGKYSQKKKHMAQSCKLYLFENVWKVTHIFHWFLHAFPHILETFFHKISFWVTHWNLQIYYYDFQLFHLQKTDSNNQLFKITWSYFSNVKNFDSLTHNITQTDLTALLTPWHLHLFPIEKKRKIIKVVKEHGYFGCFWSWSSLMHICISQRQGVLI